MSLKAPDGYAGPVAVEIDRIDPSPAARMRARIIDRTIQDYAACFDELPPIMVVAGPNDAHWTADGSYRLAAARSLGRTSINCYVKRGTEQDAWFDACRANTENRGERITSDDRVARVLACHAHPVMGKWSQHRIAEYCNEKHQFVNYVLQQRVQSGHVGVNGHVEGKNGQLQPATKPAMSRAEREEKRSEILGDLRKDHTQPDTILAEKHGVDYRMVSKVRKGNGVPPSGAKGGQSFHRPKVTPTPLLSPAEEEIVVAPTEHRDLLRLVPVVAEVPRRMPGIAERWKPIEDAIVRDFESWPESERSHFAFRLSQLSDILFAHCPGVQVRNGEILS